MNPPNAVTGTGNRSTNPPKVTAADRAVLVASSMSPSLDAFSRVRAGDFTASVRVPVRRANRAYLRALRAAELAAWERAERGTRQEPASALTTQWKQEAAENASGQRREALMHGLLAIAAAAAGLLSAQVGLELVAQWDRVVELVRAALV